MTSLRGFRSRSVRGGRCSAPAPERLRQLDAGVRVARRSGVHRAHQTRGCERVLNDGGHARRVSGLQRACRAEDLRDVIIVHGLGPFLPLARPI